MTMNAALLLPWFGGLSPFQSPIATICYGLLLGVAVGLQSNRSRRRKKPWPTAPGRTPLVGHLPLLLGGVPHLATTLEKWCDAANQGSDEMLASAQGCFEVDLAGTRFLVVYEEDRLKELIKYRLPHKMERQEDFNEAADSTGNTGVFSATGDVWKREKKYVSAALNHKHLRDYLSVFKQNAKLLIHHWKDAAKEGGGSCSLKVVDSLALLAADIIAKVSMGQDFDFLNNPKSQINRDISIILDRIVFRAISPVRYWRIPFIGQYVDGIGSAMTNVKEIINSAIQTEEHNLSTERNGASTSRSETFLQKLLVLTQDEKTALPLHRLTGNVMTLFLAGVHTTSRTIATAMYYLAKNPSLKNDLREEVDKYIHQNNPGGLEETNSEYLSTNVPRLKSFLHELHNHYGVPLVAWNTKVDIPFLETELPAGTNIMIMSKYISTNKFRPATKVPIGPNGERPHEFCAERYLLQVHHTDGSESTTCPPPCTHGGAFGGFGHGIRSCPGQAYAEVLSLVLLMNCLQHLDWELVPDHPEPNGDIYDIVNIPDCDIALKLTPRETEL